MNKQELIKHFEEMEYVSVHQMGKKAFIDMIEQLDEPQKPVVPQFVADWIEKVKGKGEPLYYALVRTPPEKVDSWFCEDEKNRQNIFARAWLDGYEVEKEKRYKVRVKGILANYSYLNHFIPDNSWLFNNSTGTFSHKVVFTRKQLEEAGFKEVFNSPLFVVEEVEE